MKIIAVIEAGLLVWAIAECWAAHREAQHARDREQGMRALYMQTLARIPQRGKRGRFEKR